MFAGDPCRKQNLRERSRITSTHGSGVIHFQSSEYVRSREPFASLFIIFSYPEAGMKDFLCRTRMIKSGVVALQFPFFFFCEPVADAGAFTTLLSLRAEYASVNIIIALVLNMIWVYFVVSMTGRVERFLGKGGIYIIRKFFGIILLAISVRLFTANKTLLIEALHRS